MERLDQQVIDAFLGELRVKHEGVSDEVLGKALKQGFLHVVLWGDRIDINKALKSTHPDIFPGPAFTEEELFECNSPGVFVASVLLAERARKKDRLIARKETLKSIVVRQGRDAAIRWCDSFENVRLG